MSEELLEHYKYDWIRCLSYHGTEDEFPDTFKEEHLGDKDMLDIYIDQMPYHSFFADRHFSSTWLEYGLKCLEGWMIHHICNESEYTVEELEYMIKRNPHLHNVIKTNLLYNLWNKKSKKK